MYHLSMTACQNRRTEYGRSAKGPFPADEPPFTNVGVNYFGPVEVKRGRSLFKRYGMILTCLAIRAVHIEVALALDTGCCINA